jgi:sulfur-oxidizing protein SoxA
VIGALALLATSLGSATAQDRGIPAADVKSGKSFVSRETQAQQDDLTDNPGMLWVEQGGELWRTPAGPSAKSCASCHGEPAAMKGVAARYPVVDAKLGRLVNIETRIQNCVVEHQGAVAPAYESQELLALTALVAHQSRGLPVSVKIDGEAAPYFAQGDKLFHEKQGHLDLSCAQCHVEHWGKRLRSETISQGYANGFPTYRLEWQTLGSSHRRLRACFQGVRAEPFAAGSPEFIALELYVAWRAEGVAVETPAVRR